MSGYSGNIEVLALKNNYFRNVLFTAPHSQLVLMSLKPLEDIGMEVHHKEDQFIRVEKGEGKALVDGEEFALEDGSAVVVPAGSEHNIINTSSTDELKLYTIYSPAHHPGGTIHKTRAEAMKADKAE